MKKQVLKILIFTLIYSNTYAASPITIYNDSNIGVYFISQTSGCSGTCTNPWTSQGQGGCCGDTAGIVGGRAYSTDPSQSGQIGLNDGAPAWAGLGYDYHVNAIAQTGRSWLAGGGALYPPGTTLRFPEDFNINAAELASITPPPKLTQGLIETLGSLNNIQNESHINFTLQGHPIPAQAAEDASTWQSPDSKFPNLWGKDKTIQFNGQLNALSRIITLTPTPHSVAIKDEILLKDASQSASQQFLDLDGIISDYIGQISNSNIVSSWTISLKFTDQNVIITDVQISHQYVGGSPRVAITDTYWIYPDKVLKRSGQGAWAPITDKPNLTKYIHQQ